jgi:adenine-specific DNA-methyltransferase
MTKEQKFFKVLQDIFIGAKIEGQGGFINLMKIKSNYYKKIEELLREDIEDALKKYPSFREELFDKLYDFFHRYFSESGSIYFNSTPFHNNIYEKVYTDDRDVILFWKTRMLYYVKTDRIFRSMPVEIPINPSSTNENTSVLKFYFDATNIENKKANEKRDLIYELQEVKEDKTIVLKVHYSEQGKVTKTDDILKELKKNNITIDEETLERAFRIFEKQSEVDFFINKNAKVFLQEQFKLWSYQYFWEGAKEWTADRVNQLQILKDIAFKIIDFISQFEDELVKIWNKPKFVKNSNYVITLDRINNIELIEKILKHQNINEQIKEWQELGIVDENFKIEDVFENDIYGKKLTRKYQHLPIDTKYFKDLELEILNQFDDLDNSLDGWLIKSENYQALNTILPKFKEKVQTIYIDPPFNKEQDADYLYNVKYKDSTWITLLENRLKLAKDLLKDTGSIFVRCDYNGNMYVRLLMNEIFGEENFRNEIVISRTRAKQQVENQFIQQTESLFFYSNTEKLLLKEVERPRIPEWHPLLHFPRADDKPRVIFGKIFYPPKGRRWALSQERINKFEKEGKIRINKELSYIDCKGNKIDSMPELLYDTEIIGNEWLDIPGYSQAQRFPTENSEVLLKRVIESTSNEGDLVMDFFLGSGTTTATAHKLKRKWIGVEMGEHFYTVVLPRMKKVLAYDKSGISKELKTPRQTSSDTPLQEGIYQGGGFFKYYELEQYEETLANTVYENHDITIIGNKTPYEQYIFLKDEKMLKALEIDYENNKVNVDLNKLYPPLNSPLNKGEQWGVDIAETLSNLTGKWIKKIRENEVEFEDGTIINTKDLDYKLIKPLIWWE